MCLRSRDSRTTKPTSPTWDYLPRRQYSGHQHHCRQSGFAPYWPCLDNGPDDTSGNPTPTLHCDLDPSDPGAAPTDAPAVQGFAAQLGFRLPNMVISPFTRRHYVSHIPMDHTAVIKFVESRFIGRRRTLPIAMPHNQTCWISSTSPTSPWLTPPTASSLPVPPVAGSHRSPQQPMQVTAKWISGVSRGAPHPPESANVGLRRVARCGSSAKACCPKRTALRTPPSPTTFAAWVPGRAAQKLPSHRKMKIRYPPPGRWPSASSRTTSSFQQAFASAAG